MIIKKIFKKRGKEITDFEEFSDFYDKEKGKKKPKSTIKRLFQLLKKIFGYFDTLNSGKFKEEFKAAFKNDIKMAAILSGLFALTLVVITVIWLFVSFAMVAHFYESGNTIVHSILFTLGFHMLILIGFISGIMKISKKFKTRKVYSEFRKSTEFQK